MNPAFFLESIRDLAETLCVCVLSPPISFKKRDERKNAQTWSDSYTNHRSGKDVHLTNRSDRPRWQTGALGPRKWAWSSAARAAVGAPILVGVGQTASTAIDSRAGGRRQGQSDKSDRGKRQRLTIIHNRSKLPPNFGNPYK